MKKEPQKSEKTGEARKEAGQRQPTKKSIFQFLCTQKTEVGWLKRGCWGDGDGDGMGVPRMHQTMVPLSPSSLSLSLAVSFCSYCPLTRAEFHPLVALPHTHTITNLAASHEGPRTKDEGRRRRPATPSALAASSSPIQQQVDEDVDVDVAVDEDVAASVAVEVEKTRKNVT